MLIGSKPYNFVKRLVSEDSSKIFLGNLGIISFETAKEHQFDAVVALKKVDKGYKCLGYPGRGKTFLPMPECFDNINVSERFVRYVANLQPLSTVTAKERVTAFEIEDIVKTKNEEAKVKSLV